MCLELAVSGIILILVAAFVAVFVAYIDADPSRGRGRHWSEGA
jgi:hypothetical protein